MNMKVSKITLSLLASAFFLLTANTVFAGLGVSPSQIVAPNLSKGAHMEKTFVLSRNDPKEDLYFKVNMEGSTKDWTTLDRGVEFIMPAGEQRFSIVVVVNIPNDTANGEYKGGIRLESFSKSSDNAGGSGVSTALSALIQTDFTITGEQVLEYEISSIKIQNTEEGFPLGLSVGIINTGNVTARPTKVHIEVLDKFNTELLEAQDITEMGFVEPFMTGDIAIPVPIKLGVDQYWATVFVYRDDILLKESSIFFEVVEAGSLKAEGVLKEVINKKEIELGEIVKITGVFENTGAKILSAKLMLEVYQGDKLIGAIEGEPANISAGKTENLIAFFKPSETGKYAIKTRAAYSGKSTLVKESIFIVKGGSGMLGVGTIAAVIIMVIILIVTVAKSAVFRKK